MEENFENQIEEPISVFIKVNEKNEIVDVASSVFLKNTEGWIEIDSGYGDKFAHAQNSYFDKPIIDDLGNYQIKYFAQ